MQQLAAITLGTLGGALGVAQQQAAHFQYEDQQFAALEREERGQSAGRLQAAQVTNEILLAQAQQITASAPTTDHPDQRRGGCITAPGSALTCKALCRRANS